MGKKQIIGLIIVLVILGGLIGGWLILKNHDTEKNTKKQEVLLKVNPAEVNSYSYTAYGSTTSYEKKNNNWTNPSNKKEKIDSSSIQTEVSNICSAKKYDTVKKVSDYDQFGFTVKNGKVISGKTNITLKTENGKTYKYYAGKTNPYDDSQCYVMLEGDKKVYITDADAFTTLGGSQGNSSPIQMNGIQQ